MIQVDHLCYHYKGGRPILRDVSFELDSGHFLAVLGNNGVGKSTLLKCINRILTADSGSCRVDGEDLLALSHREIAKRVAFVAQHVPDTQMTVHDMVICVSGTCCATKATRFAISRWESVSRSSPSIRQCPLSAVRIRFMHLSSVLLPTPLLPSTARKCPASSSKLTSRRIGRPPL